jgi:hypothetical protein
MYYGGGFIKGETINRPKLSSALASVREVLLNKEIEKAENVKRVSGWQRPKLDNNHALT